MAQCLSPGKRGRHNLREFMSCVSYYPYQKNGFGYVANPYCEKLLDIAVLLSSEGAPCIVDLVILPEALSLDDVSVDQSGEDLVLTGLGSNWRSPWNMSESWKGSKRCKVTQSHPVTWSVTGIGPVSIDHTDTLLRHSTHVLKPFPYCL